MGCAIYKTDGPHSFSCSSGTGYGTHQIYSKMAENSCERIESANASHLFIPTPSVGARDFLSLEIFFKCKCPYVCFN